MQKLNELSQQAVIFLGDSIRIEVHYIIANPTDMIKFADENLPINCQAGFRPIGWILKQSYMFSKGQIGNAFDFPLRVHGVFRRGKFLSREFAVN
jgi:hypothetical protein